MSEYIDNSQKRKEALKKLILDLHAGGDLEEINRRREEEGEPSYANPRNLTAGTLKLLDPRQVAKRPLRFRAYRIVETERLGIRSQMETLERLGAFGFSVDGAASLRDGIEAAAARCLEMQEER